MANKPPTLDLLTLPLLGRFWRWRHARTAMQIPLLLVALVVVWDGFTGSPLAPRNLATILPWLHYRGFVILALLVFGNAFCMACPFMLPRNALRRFIQPTRHWPARLRNKWLAAALFALFLFVYERYDLWSTPWWTAWLIVGYFVTALLLDSLFDGAPFCKYVCPLGQFNFLGSLVSPFEVRVRSQDVCAACTTHDCLRGRGTQRGCELWLFQPRKVGNLDCTFCLDCVHACPHDNIGIQPRLPAAELWFDGARSGVGRLFRRADFAALTTIFVFGALLNAFGMVSPVYTLQAWLANLLHVQSETPVLAIIFGAALLLEPLLLLGGAAWLTRRLAHVPHPLVHIALRYVYTLVPFGVGMWAAHYAFHFLSGFWSFVPVVQSIALEFGITWLGRPHWELAALLPLAWLDPLEWGLIGLGAFGSLIAITERAQRDAPHAWQRAALPWVGVLLVLTLSALWLMTQPMEMRGTLLG